MEGSGLVRSLHEMSVTLGASTLIETRGRRGRVGLAQHVGFDFLRWVGGVFAWLWDEFIEHFEGVVLVIDYVGFIALQLSCFVTSGESVGYCFQVVSPECPDNKEDEGSGEQADHTKIEEERRGEEF